jgi:VWFA-related protein
MPYRQQRIIAFGLNVLLFASIPIWGRQEPTEAQKHEPVTITAAEVVVDVIVTDKKNRMITDLTPADFEVLEDGIKQNLKSVRLERRGEATPPGPGDEATPAQIAPDQSPTGARRAINPVLLIFDNLSMSKASQVFARRAANDYIDSIAPNDRLAVFGIDTRLFLAQSFSNDKAALKKAVEQVTTGISQQFTSSAAAIERILQSPTFSNAADGGAQPANRLAAAEQVAAGLNSDLGAAIDAVLLGAFRSFEVYEREVQARTTILALLALIQAQRVLPGRKTVIMFSEGFALPGSLSDQFKSVIGAANRSNVALYTIDAGGLRVDSESERVSRELSSMTEARARGADPTRVEGGESMLGRAESLGRANRESVLTELAESTGGISIRNTNDLRSGLTRIDEDMRRYYILSYAPSNQSFDGRFRTVQVRVNRPNVMVRARTGYYALRTAETSPVFAFEQPLFDVLSNPSPPHEFAFDFRAMHFPGSAPAAPVSVVAQIPGTILNLTEVQAEEGKKGKKDEKKSYVGELTVMALVKDAQGIVVRKLSRNYRLTSDRPDGLKETNIIFYRTAPVPPGTYQLDIVARDAPSQHASVQHVSLIVPASSSAPLRISSIVPTKGGEPLKPQERDENNPFHYGTTVIMPNLSGKFSKSKDSQMMFYFVVQTTPNASVQTKIEFLQQGQVLAQTSGALPPPDQKGRIQFVAQFPLAPFPEGAYDVRITVQDGANRASEKTSFTVVN